MEVEIALITRALRQPSFKDALLSDPKLELERELGARLPQHMNVQLLEEDENTLYLVIPNNPYGDLAEKRLKESLNLTNEDVARWLLDHQRNTLLDVATSARIVARVWSDEAFKQTFVTDPITVLTEFYGTDIRGRLAGMKVRVRIEDTHTLFIVLPSQAKTSSLRLDEDFLRDLQIVNLQVALGSPAGTACCSETVFSGGCPGT